MTPFLFNKLTFAKTVTMCIYHDITMHNDVAMGLLTHVQRILLTVYYLWCECVRYYDHVGISESL